MRHSGRPQFESAVGVSALAALVALIAGFMLACQHPVAPVALPLAFVLWSVLIAWKPGLWLFALTAALPLSNFSPWTGWIAFEEFDLLLWGVVAGGYARLGLARWTAGAAPPGARTDLVCLGLAGVLGAFGIAALVRGMLVASSGASGLFESYADPLNSWRVFKPLLHAALIWPLLRWEISRNAESATRCLASGILVGLTLVTLAVVWERLAYTGLWDFSARYRTTALFWEMHVGGAAIDVYLVLATPFVAWALWTTRSPLLWALAAVLALLTGYACLTTFSRGVYGAVAGSLLLLALLLRGRRLPRIRWRVVGGFALAVALTLEVAAVLGLGSFMRERMAASDHDMDGRLKHWENGLALLQSPSDWMLGIGLGRLPAAYAQAHPGSQFPGEVAFIPPAGGQPTGTVRMAGPKSPPRFVGQMALTQRVALRPVPGHVVGFDVRAQAEAVLYFQLCEMHLLFPRNCQSGVMRVSPGSAAWRHAAVRLNGPLLDVGSFWAPRMGVFSVSVLNHASAAELDNLSLVGPDGVELLANRDFSEGLARWFPAAQGYYFVPWHIDNLFLELLIERGVVALLAFALFMGWTLWRLVGAAGRGVPIAPFLIASLCGGLCVGLVSSVLDVPRVAFLMFLIALFSAEVVRDPLRSALPGSGDERPA